MDLVWDNAQNYDDPAMAQPLIDAARQYRCISEIRKVIAEQLEIAKARVAVLGEVIVDHMEKIANEED